MPRVRYKGQDLPYIKNGLTHAEVATQYARDVVDGKIPNCKWVKLAALRHINDLVESQNTDYPYEYDLAKGSRPCRFIELLPHVAGKWANRNELIKLEPWQCFIICSLYGWVKKSDGFRRFKRAYCCIPRKNAKSTLAAGLALYALILDNEYGAQVYSGATSREQAAFVFSPAREMAAKTDTLRDKYGVEVNADSITILSKNSKFTRLIGNPGDGSSPSFCACDEYHEHLDSRLHDTMTSGMGARDQPMMFVITTAGYDTAGPCYLLQKDMEKVLEGLVDAPTRFAIIYSIDEDDDWTTLDSLIKANPNWGISVNAEDAIAEQQEAILSSEKQNLFKTKKLNIWCFARNGFFNVDKWNKCTDSALTMEQFAGEPCVKGLDLASQIDLAADVTVFQRMVEDSITKKSLMHYYIFCKAYIPEATVALPTNQQYQKWVHDGHLIATPGDEIDFATIKNSILVDIAEYDVKELDYDKHQGTFLKQQLVDETGIEGVEIAQNPPTLNIPMKWLQAMINAGRIHHNGNPVMTWCISNVVSREDANENDFPRKERPESKIDCVAALLNALSRIRAALGEDTGAFYDYNGF